MAATPLLGQYLVAINGFINARNERSLAEWIALEPPFNDHYARLISELQHAYPRGSEEALESRCRQALRAAVEGEGWSSFVTFLAHYLAYLRDVSADASQYLHTYDLLSELQQRANTALAHPTLGYLILPTLLASAKLVCRLAIGLDKQPALIAHLRAGGGGGGAGEDGGPRETLPERAANLLRHPFVTCLNDRASGLSPTTGQPEGKKRGIYALANLCLKILFQCRKTRAATQIFDNISTTSPPLAAYPKAERVTYLYYLGRFLFHTAHFYRAQAALQAAYDECPAHPTCVRQRRHILIYLIASNLTLGRFPSTHLLNRPEAAGLSERFTPLCLAIRQGHLAAFRHHLAIRGPYADWFLHFRLLLPLRNRCEPLLWRSVVRKTWLLAGTRPAMESKVTPQTTLADLAAAFTWLSSTSSPSSSSNSTPNDHDGDEEDEEEDYTDPDFHHLPRPPLSSSSSSPLTHQTIPAIESKLAALIDQGLLNGFLAHRQAKFCITGVKAKGGDILAAGFPRPWSVLCGKAVGRSAGAGGKRRGEEVEEEVVVVPGWRRQGVPLVGAGGGAAVGAVG